MSFTGLMLIAIGLSMDAFAVSVCKGLGMKKLNKKHAVIIGLFFGGFQALMPLIGWAVGTQFSDYVTKYSHWIAFILLAFIGGKMIIEAIKDETPDDKSGDKLDIKELLILSIATSIDALTVGITFAFLNVSIIPSVTAIGVITFALSVLGVYIGNKFGSKYKNKAEFVGGLILVLMGTKILLEHLGVF